ISTDFHMDWSFGSGNLSGSQPNLAFNNVQLHLGTFISGFVAPILRKVKEYLDPVKPIVDALQTRLPVISDLAGKDTTLVDLAADLAQASGDKRALEAVAGTKIFLSAFNTIYSLAASIPDNPGDITL